ncbi:hypothetical protein D3C78_1826200 [compost metagenome]
MKLPISRRRGGDFSDRVSMSAKGSTAMAAMAKRRPTNQNGPIEAMAEDCATKPPPQIAAASRSSILA